jgi:predicted Zn-dependent protease
MQLKTKEEIEKIFLTESSFDKLFDAFKLSIDLGLEDTHLFQVLLANPHLTKEQVTFFSESCCKYFPENSYSIYLWTGNILEQACTPYEKNETAFEYYKKAANLNPTQCEPYINMLNLYDYEFNRDTNKTIIDLINSNLKSINDKPKIFTLLREHFKKMGDEQKQIACAKLAAKYSKRSN